VNGALVMKPASLLRVQRYSDTLRLDNGSGSGSDYSDHPFGERLPGPFGACAGAGFSPSRLSGTPLRRVLFPIYAIGLFITQGGKLSSAKRRC